MPLDEGMRRRFQEELDLHGIDNYKAASRKARWPDGTRLGATYIRDALNKDKRGSFQGIELICIANKMDFLFVKTGKRPQLFLPSPTTDNATAPLDYDELSGLIASALRIYGASPQAAESTAQTVLTTWLGKKTP